MLTMRSGVRTGLLVAAVGAAWALDARRRSKRLRTTHRILVDLLLNALMADDPVTARHSRRVADLSYALGRAAGLDREDLATLRVAALLHDLGKIDDRLWRIVHSRDRLNDQERAEMKRHPDESARILEPLEAIHPGIGAVVASHHECWDGSGYPDGLVGEEIPVGARIISVADAFDAMTQPRKYSGPLSPEETLEQLRRGAGRQFDPSLLEVLSDPELLEEWMELARQGLSHEEAIPEDQKEMVAETEPR